MLCSLLFFLILLVPLFVALPFHDIASSHPTVIVVISAFVRLIVPLNVLIMSFVLSDLC